VKDTNRIMTNWKTTLAGCLAGSVPFIQGVAESLQTGATIQWHSLLLGLCLMALGIVARDALPSPKP